MINEDALADLLFCMISGIKDAKGFNEEESEEMRELITKAIKSSEVQ